MYVHFLNSHIVRGQHCTSSFTSSLVHLEHVLCFLMLKTTIISHRWCAAVVVLGKRLEKFLFHTPTLPQTINTRFIAGLFRHS